MFVRSRSGINVPDDRVATLFKRVPRFARRRAVGRRRTICVIGFVAFAFIAIGRFNVEPRPAAVAMDKIKNFREKARATSTRFFAGSSKARTQTLVTARGYQLVLRQNRGQLFPRIKLRPVLPKPVSLTSLSASVDGGVDDLRGFPFTTSNRGRIKLAFDRIGGELIAVAEDPTVSLDSDDAKRVGEVSYRQRIPAGGDVSLRARTDGDWAANFSGNVEDVGFLSGSLDQQLDWSLNLEKEYSHVKGFVPTASYGATQDGMRVRAELAGQLPSKQGVPVNASYAIGNLPGQYAPADFVHECAVKMAFANRRYSLESRGEYNRRLAKSPIRGSLACSARVKRAAIEGYLDFDRCHFLCQLPRGLVRVATAVNDGDSLKEFEVQFDKLSATALLVNSRPRIHLRFDSTFG
eukprot:TRINITY_DN45726_c0_g1_i1.p1 TRINITY_DN45726_c0_g1~~TRINITY_DN45726_c0_g1_i1.p1  ORF type:complete len:428 (+),score=68.82 TRINITY_DN45726_c0_g1_i1:63-1286(+)